MRTTPWRMAVAVAVAVLLMASETTTLYRDVLYVAESGLLVAAVVLPGLVVRTLRPRLGPWRWPLWLLQVACGAGVMWWLHRGHTVRELVTGGITAIQEGTAPLAASPGAGFLFLLLPLLAVVLLELFVHVGAMPGATLLPLAAWYVLFAMVPTPQARWLSLAAMAVGWIAILAADTANRGRHWRSAVAGDTGSGSDSDVTVARLAATLGVPALLAALVAGSMMPVFTREELSSTNGSVAMGDPRIDLRQNLHATRRTEVLQYQTATGGVRLRLAVLTDLSAEGWNVEPFPSTRLGRDEQVFGPVPGLTLIPGTERRTQISIGTFPSQYLPLPYAPERMRAPKQWGYDPSTLMVYTLDPSGRDATNHLAYEVDSRDVQPSVAQLQEATVTGAPGRTDEVPTTLPRAIQELTDGVTAGARTPLEKASALQQFFRGPSFTYDLNKAPDQAGFAGLEQFLLTERVGYCEQYASAYAIMARAAGLPSRVVIGFLPGQEVAGGTYSVANLDMHAWPEVWFDGYGWLAFEPTPPAVSGEPPAYTAQVDSSVGEPTPTPTPTAPTAAPSTDVAPSPAPTTQVEVQTVQVRQVPWGLLWTLAGTAVAIVVALLPAWWRARRRAERIGLRDVPRTRTLALWDEVRDTVVDLGGQWPAESPRALSHRVGAPLSGRAQQTLAELGLAVERARFGRVAGEPPADAPARVLALLAELQTQARPGQRLLARFLPRSLWPRTLRRRG